MVSRTESSKSRKARTEARKQKQFKENEEREALRTTRKLHKEQQRTRHYDENGVRIGDDGYPMTKARMRLHRLYDCYFFYMLIALLVGVGLIVLSLFQGQQITEWELVWYGGTQFNGLSLATVLRAEALYLMFVVAISLFSNMKGMAWMYDKGPEKPVKITIFLSGIVSGVYFCVFAFIVGIPDVFSMITLCMSILNWKFVQDVKLGRSNLKKAKIATTVVKGR